MENLRIIREKRHKSQLNVAMAVGVKQESISMYESGVSYPSAKVLIALAKIPRNKYRLFIRFNR